MIRILLRTTCEADFHLDDSVDEMAYFPVWLLPDSAMGLLQCVTASWGGGWVGLHYGHRCQRKVQRKPSIRSTPTPACLCCGDHATPEHINDELEQRIVSHVSYHAPYARPPKVLTGRSKPFVCHTTNSSTSQPMFLYLINIVSREIKFLVIVFFRGQH